MRQNISPPPDHHQHTETALSLVPEQATNLKLKTNSLKKLTTMLMILMLLLLLLMMMMMMMRCFYF